jgi:large repetitive protein
MPVPMTPREGRRSVLLLALLSALALLVAAPSAMATHKPGHQPGGGGGGGGDDTTPPETTITSAPSSPTTSTDATFRFTSSEKHSTFTCSLDGSSFQECSSPRTYRNLSLGDHVFRVRATDRAGNTDPTPAEHHWRIVGSDDPNPGEPVQCGQTLTKNTTVGNDLSECEDGLIVGADNITINLNGHVIDGKGLGAGIRNDGFDGVTITNGTVKDFDYGVQLNPGTERNSVHTLGIDDNEVAGVEIHGAGPSNEIRNNGITLNGLGVALVAGATGNTVVSNTIADNSKQGIYIHESNENRAEANGVTGSSDDAIELVGASGNVLLNNATLVGGDAGVSIIAGSNGNRVERNTSNDNGDAGFAVLDSDGNQLLSNTAHGNADSGIVLEGTANTTVLSNDVRLNPGGLLLMATTGSRVESNVVTDNLGRGVELSGSSFGNTLLLNMVATNNGQGIYVGDEATDQPGNTLDRNTVNGNAGDGIHLAKGGHTVRQNTADNNNGWGIYGALGTIDGGGNRASGNSQPEQCFNVTCS